MSFSSVFKTKSEGWVTKHRDCVAIFCFCSQNGKSHFKMRVCIPIFEDIYHSTRDVMHNWRLALCCHHWYLCKLHTSFKTTRSPLVRALGIKLYFGSCISFTPMCTDILKGLLVFDTTSHVRALLILWTMFLLAIPVVPPGLISSVTTSVKGSTASVYVCCAQTTTKAQRYVPYMSECVRTDIV